MKTIRDEDYVEDAKLAPILSPTSSLVADQQELPKSVDVRSSEHLQTIPQDSGIIRHG